MNKYESLKETLSFCGVKTNEPYYISTGNQILKFPERPFRMDFYAFCICISGTIDVEIDNEQFSIGANGFLISAPSTILHFVKNSADFRMKVLFFDKTFLLKNITNPFFIEKLNLFSNTNFSVVSSDESQSKRLLRILDYLYEQKERKIRFVKDIIRTIIVNLLLEISAIIEQEKKTISPESATNTDHLFYKFKNLVQEHILSSRSVSFYAEKLFVSSKNLIVIIKKYSGKTPHQIIDEELLKVTYVQLGNPEKNVSEIAFELGFSSTSAFGRFFKKHVTISPQEFRKQLFIK